MSKFFFKIPGASNPSSHTRTHSADHNYPKSFAGTATIFTLVKRSEAKTSLTGGKRNISRSFRNMVTLLQLLIMSKQDHFDILAFAKTVTTTVKLRRTCLFKSYNQHWMPMPAVKSFYFILRKPFHCVSLQIASVWNVSNVFCLGSRPSLLLYIKLNSFPKIFNGYTFENVCWLAYETSRL